MKGGAGGWWSFWSSVRHCKHCTRRLARRQYLLGGRLFNLFPHGPVLNWFDHKPDVLRVFWLRCQQLSYPFWRRKHDLDFGLHPPVLFGQSPELPPRLFPKE
jgi:hypothetical protein